MSRELDARVDTWTTQICRYCNKSFKARVCYVKRGQMKFCSAKCSQVSSRTKDSITYEGVRFVVNIHGHYQGSINTSLYLHRLIWEDNYGPIPDKHVIHHKNENKLDNRLDNLECLPWGEHTALHNLGKDRTKPKQTCQVEDCQGV